MTFFRGSKNIITQQELDTKGNNKGDHFLRIIEWIQTDLMTFLGAQKTQLHNKSLVFECMKTWKKKRKLAGFAESIHDIQIMINYDIKLGIFAYSAKTKQGPFPFVTKSNCNESVRESFFATQDSIYDIWTSSSLSMGSKLRVTSRKKKALSLLSLCMDFPHCITKGLHFFKVIAKVGYACFSSKNFNWMRLKNTAIFKFSSTQNFAHYAMTCKIFAAAKQKSWKKSTVLLELWTPFVLD